MPLLAAGLGELSSSITDIHTGRAPGTPLSPQPTGPSRLRRGGRGGGLAPEQARLNASRIAQAHAEGNRSEVQNHYAFEDALHWSTRTICFKSTRNVTARVPWLGSSLGGWRLCRSRTCSVAPQEQTVRTPRSCGLACLLVAREEGVRCVCVGGMLSCLSRPEGQQCRAPPHQPSTGSGSLTGRPAAPAASVGAHQRQPCRAGSVASPIIFCKWRGFIQVITKPDATQTMKGPRKLGKIRSER